VPTTTASQEVVEVSLMLTDNELLTLVEESGRRVRNLDEALQQRYKALPTNAVAGRAAIALARQRLLGLARQHDMVMPYVQAAIEKSAGKETR
jgi:hypothetical protein